MCMSPCGLTMTGCAAVADGLDGDRARLQECQRREMALLVYVSAITALSLAGREARKTTVRSPPWLPH